MGLMKTAFGEEAYRAVKIFELMGREKEIKLDSKIIVRPSTFFGLLLCYELNSLIANEFLEDFQSRIPGKESKLHPAEAICKTHQLSDFLGQI